MVSRPLAVLCAAVLGLILLAGCGGSADVTGGGGSTPPAAGPITSPQVSPATVSPATQQQLKKIVLQASDLPPGWKAGPYIGPDEDDVNRIMTRCMGIRDTNANRVAKVSSDEYTRGNVQVYSVAASYRSERDLDEDFSVLRNPKLAPCTEQLFRKIMEVAGVGTIGSISVKAVPVPAGSPANVIGVTTISMEVTGGARTAVVYTQSALIRGPLIEAEVEMASTGEPIPQALMNSLVAKVASRAAHP